MDDSRQGVEAQTDDRFATAAQRAARGESLTGAEERDALDYLLGAPVPARYHVEVQYETPDGLSTLRFCFVGMDGRKIDKIEQRNISPATGMMDKPTADAELVAEATEKIEVPTTGHSIEPSSTEFRTIKPGDPPLAATVDALNARFGTQIGLLAGVASAIREAAGWKADRVGKATRVLVTAAGN